MRDEQKGTVRCLAAFGPLSEKKFYGNTTKIIKKTFFEMEGESIRLTHFHPQTSTVPFLNYFLLVRKCGQAGKF